MIIECPQCESKVDGKELASVDKEMDDGDPYLVTLLKCPICNMPILAGQEFEPVDEESAVLEAGEAFRLWPEPDEYFDWGIPTLVRDALVEARKCYRAKAYKACAVMCGQVLEGIAREHGTRATAMLAGGLKALLDKGVIDQRIYQWGEALREYRNIGAHPTIRSISKEDASSLLEFATAICNYVFVLNRKFEEFMTRTKARRSND